MKKQTVIRQNSCAGECRAILFAACLLFTAMQLLADCPKQLRQIHAINMALYLLIVPGFVFYAGYRFWEAAGAEEKQENAMLSMAGSFFCLYVILAAGQSVWKDGLPLKDAVAGVLTMTQVPSSAGIFFSMMIFLLFVHGFRRLLFHLIQSEKRRYLMAAVCLLTAWIQTKNEMYAPLEIFVKVKGSSITTILPYFGYFLFGICAAKKKQAVDRKEAGIAFGITVISALLCKTPVGEIAKVTISVFPIVLLYLISSRISDQTGRYVILQKILKRADLLYLFLAVVLFGCLRLGLFHQGTIAAAMCGALFSVAAVCLVIVFYWCFHKIYGWFEWKERQGELHHKMAWYFLIYTIVFAGCLLLFLVPFFRAGRTLIWKNDGISQYYPRAIYYIQYVRELFSNLMHGNWSLPMYDLTIGMGSEIVFSTEPLYFLFAVFGERHVEFAYSFLICLRFYLAGLSVSCLLIYFKKDYKAVLIASMIYVFCGYSLYGGARHVMFMVPMILTPWMIMAIEEILRGKKWYLMTLVTAVFLFSNYYFLYMSTIGAGIYFIIRFVCNADREQKKFLKFIQKGLIISGSYLLGVGMACLTLATTFGMYVGSGRKGSILIQTPSLFYYSSEWIVRCFLTFLTSANSPGEWLKLGFLPIAFLAVVLLFVQKDRKELKCLSVAALFCMILPAAGFVFSGFSTVTNRWCYLAALLTAYIAAEMIPQFSKMIWKEILLCGCLVLIYGYLYFFGTVLTTKYVKMAFYCLVLTYLVVLMCHERIRIPQSCKAATMLLLTAAMVLVQSYTLFTASGVVKEYAKPGQAQSEIEMTPLTEIKEAVGDESFYRVMVPKLRYNTISSAMVYGYHSLTLFYSTLNASVCEYLAQMGAASYSATQLMGLNNRTFLSALAAVKYYAYFDETDKALPYGYEVVKKTKKEDRAVTILENKEALPIGYTYSETVTPQEFETYDAPEKAEVLMQKVLWEDADSGQNEETAVKKDMTLLTGKTLEYKIEKEQGLKLTEASLIAKEDPDDSQTQKRKLKLSFDGQADAETYIVLKNAVLKGDSSEKALMITLKNKGNTTSYKFRPEDDRYGSGQSDYVLSMGYHKEAISSCTLSFDRDAEVTFDSIEIYSQPMEKYEAYVSQRKETVLEQVQIGENRISGKISLDRSKYLVMSVPYQKGWKAYLDGQEAEIVRANGMYLGLEVPVGEHEIVFTYEIPHIRQAFAVMGVSFVIFLVLVLKDRILERRKKKEGR